MLNFILDILAHFPKRLATPALVHPMQTVFRQCTRGKCRSSCSIHLYYLCFNIELLCLCPSYLEVPHLLSSIGSIFCAIQHLRTSAGMPTLSGAFPETRRSRVGVGEAFNSKATCGNMELGESHNICLECYYTCNEQSNKNHDDTRY